MESVYLVLTGITFGGLFVATGSVLGAYLVKKTYSTVTEPQEFTVNLSKGTGDSSQEFPEEADAYDWDQYDEYLRPPKDEEGGEPEA